MKLVTILPEIQTGDLLLFRRSPSLFARAIRLWTRSVFSHVGIVLWIHLTADCFRLCVLEALEPGGVRLFPLDRYLDQCGRQGAVVDWYQLVDPAVDRYRVAAFALRQWGKRYASPWQFLWSFGWLTSLVRRLSGDGADTNADRFFCSELAADALRFGGFVPDESLPAAAALTDPGSVALFSCLRRRGNVEAL